MYSRINDDCRSIERTSRGRHDLMLRDGLKAGIIKPDEIAARIGEVYNYVIDSRVALSDAQEEIRNLKQQLDSMNRDALVLLDGAVYWEKRTDGVYDGPLCPVCWD